MKMIQEIIVLALVGMAAGYDVRTGKIPNKLIIAGYLFGMLFSVNELSDIPASLGSALWPILLWYPLFLFRAIGAGDIKLFSVVSVFYTYKVTLSLMFGSLVVGALISAAVLMGQKGLSQRKDDSIAAQLRLHRFTGGEAALHKIHFAPCIAAACLIRSIMEVIA